MSPDGGLDSFADFGLDGNARRILGDEARAGVVFGPVPSRRLGKSLGINHIPPTTCSYSCVYCQLGRERRMTIERGVFYSPTGIFRDVSARLAQCRAEGQVPDYLAFVPDGEPALDSRLGETLRRLQSTGIRTAVITNASLLWREDVRRDLMKADWVSVKVDAAREETWRRINRPFGTLRLDRVLRGIREFSRHFRGELVSETMLVRGMNDSLPQLRALAEILAGCRVSTAYLSIPSRPPAEARVRPPDARRMRLARRVLETKIGRVVLLSEPEGNDFDGRGERDLLNILSVHPMRQEAVRRFLRRSGIRGAAMDRLVREGRVIRTRHAGEIFFRRNIFPGEAPGAHAGSKPPARSSRGDAHEA